MTSKSRTKSKIVLDTTHLNKNIRKFQRDNGLLVYTLLTFLFVIVLYYGTKEWKGITSPEEVDLGSVGLTSHRRRKHAHNHRERNYED